MADFKCWKYENLVSFAEAASARLMEMEKRIATERMLAYEWGYADGLEKRGRAIAGGGEPSSNPNVGRSPPGEL